SRSPASRSRGTPGGMSMKTAAAPARLPNGGRLPAGRRRRCCKSCSGRDPAKKTDTICGNRGNATKPLPLMALEKRFSRAMRGGAERMRTMISAEKLTELQKKIHYTFRNDHLLVQALTHSSFSNEGKKHGKNNERLEFLGDSVL